MEQIYLLYAGGGILIVRTLGILFTLSSSRKELQKNSITIQSLYDTIDEQNIIIADQLKDIKHQDKKILQLEQQIPVMGNVNGKIVPFTGLKRSNKNKSQPRTQYGRSEWLGNIALYSRHKPSRKGLPLKKSKKK